MSSIRGEQDCKKYGRFSVYIRSYRRADTSDFPRIEHFGRFDHGLVELRLIYETGPRVHNLLLRVSGWIVAATGYFSKFTNPTNSSG